jgi:PilZ domain
MQSLFPDFEEQTDNLIVSRSGPGSVVALIERRGKPRINEPFPAKVLGEDIEGNTFAVPCVLNNISAHGLYLIIERQVMADAELKVIVNLFARETTGASVEIHGRVLRAEGANGKYGLGLRFIDYRFL